MNIKPLLDRLGMSQKQFARAFGLQVETVHRWTRGVQPRKTSRALLQLIEADPEWCCAVVTGQATNMLKLHEASVLVDKSTDHLRYAIKTGRLRGVKLGACWYVSPTDLASFAGLS